MASSTDVTASTMTVPGRAIRFESAPRWWYGAVVMILSAWVLHSFLHALLAACVTAVASWPLYARFRRVARRRCGPATSALVFTVAITVFVLAPLVFAVGALLTEVHTLLLEIAAADKQGLAAPAWLDQVPMAGTWLTRVWNTHLAHPDALSLWAQRTDPAALLGWAQSLGRFMVHHLFIIAFTILLLFFLYDRGEAIGRDAKSLLRHVLGERADYYVDLFVNAVRGSVNSMLVVALFDGLATGGAYALLGVARPLMWGAITGALALVPFMGYAAVAALALQLSIIDAATSPLGAVALGSLVLLCGDKVVRPMVGRDRIRLRFVWVLIGCLGGFEVLGLIGLMIGPVVLTLARELWQQHVRDVAVADLLRTSVPLDAGHATRNPDETATVP